MRKSIESGVGLGVSKFFQKKGIAMKLRQSMVGILILLWSYSASAALFNYSYTFTTGDVVSGSFSGTANGLYIENVSNVSAAYNGIFLPGSGNLFAINYSPSTSWDNTVPATVSFVATLNDFMFSETNYPTVPSQNHFYMAYYDNIGCCNPQSYSAYLALNDQQIHHETTVWWAPGYDPARWSVTEVTEAVPEPTALALLTLGLAGLGFSRRKKA